MMVIEPKNSGDGWVQGGPSFDRLARPRTRWALMISLGETETETDYVSLKTKNRQLNLNLKVCHCC